MGRLSRDKRDVFYRRAKETGYRARSAFKLLQLDAEFNLLGGGVASGDTVTEAAEEKNVELVDGCPTTASSSSSSFNNSNNNSNNTVVVRRAVDLCAAPGSWSQVLADRLYTRDELEAFQSSGTSSTASSEKASDPSLDYRIVAVDLQPMAPIDGVICMQGDITSIQTAQAIIEQFHGHRAELVVCDGAPDVTGLHDLDEFLQGQLLLSAVKISTHLLRPGSGTFLAKIFRGRQVSTLCAQLRLLFHRVSVAKPTSSRNSSLEAFVVCQHFKGGSLCNLPLDHSILSSLDSASSSQQHESETHHSNQPSLDPFIIPFVACGDLSGWQPPVGLTLDDAGVLDADKSYPMATTTTATGIAEEQVKDHDGYIAPLVPPIKPPYESSMAQEKKNETKRRKSSCL